MLGICVGLLVPLVGTVLGAGLAFLLPQGGRCARWLSGLSAGAMLASAVWSLLIPALERGFWGAAAGFSVGMLGLTVPDRILERRGRRLDPGSLLLLAVMLHNIPEGMAVGAGYAGFLWGEEVSELDALTLAVGIGLQNLPDGAVVVIPLVSAGMPRRRAFALGFLSGAVEPLAAALMLIFAPATSVWLGAFMGFAAGAMVFVVVRELVPQMGEGTMPAVLFTAGFLLLMGMDCLG